MEIFRFSGALQRKRTNFSMNFWLFYTPLSQFWGWIRKNWNKRLFDVAHHEDCMCLEPDVEVFRWFSGGLQSKKSNLNMRFWMFYMLYHSFGAELGRIDIKGYLMLYIMKIVCVWSLSWRFVDGSLVLFKGKSQISTWTFECFTRFITVLGLN